MSHSIIYNLARRIAENEILNGIQTPKDYRIDNDKHSIELLHFKLGREPSKEEIISLEKEVIAWMFELLKS